MMMSKLKAAAVVAVSGCGIAFGAAALTYQERGGPAAPTAESNNNCGAGKPNGRGGPAKRNQVPIRRVGRRFLFRSSLFPPRI